MSPNVSDTGAVGLLRANFIRQKMKATLVLLFVCALASFAQSVYSPIESQMF